MQKFKLKQIAARYGWDMSQLYHVVDDLEGIDAKFWICGGALRRPILKEDTFEKSDFDFFFGSMGHYNTVKEALLARGYKLHRANDSNEEFHKEDEIDSKKVTIRVQLIKVSFYADLEAVLGSFDFTLCQLGWEPKTDDFICGDTSLYDIANKRIVMNKLQFPVASLRRIIKYTNQGFWACQGAMTEFLTMVQKHDKDVSQETVRYFD